MKKLLAVLLAITLITGLAACTKNSGGDTGSESSGAAPTTRVIFDTPAGYEKTAEGNVTTIFTIENGEGEVLRGISVNVIVAEDNYKKGLTSKDQQVLEDELLTEFAENLTVNFTTVGDYPGIRIDDTNEQGELVEITYLLLVGDWTVMVYNSGSDHDIQGMDADMVNLIKSMRLEEVSFSA